MPTPLQPTEVEIKLLDGSFKTYVLSKFPAIAGREIVAGYPLTGIPKIGDYATNEVIMLKLMSYVGVRLPSGDVLMLTTRTLVDNHVPDYEALVRIEIEMMKYNTSFFGKGEISTFLGTFLKRVLGEISPTLTNSLAQLSARLKQPSKS